MNLTKIFQIAAVSLVAVLGFASPAQAAVTATFSAGASCGGATSASFSTGGAPVQVSLCMTTTAPTTTCGHTIVLQSAAGEGGRFVVTSPPSLGAGYSDPNSEVSQIPLAINNPPTVADFGGTSSAPVATAVNQLLATFNLSPQASATNATYVISLNSVSTVAVDADGTCGATTVPTESPITASFTLNRNNAPLFTSAIGTTFSSATASNTFTVTATGNPTPTISAGALPAGVAFASGGANSGFGTLTTTQVGASGGSITFTATGSTTVQQTFTLSVSGQASQTIAFANPGTQTFSATPITLTASASSGLTVAFSTSTPSVCSIVGANVTMLTIGTCTIAANQTGNATYLAAPQVTQGFGIAGSVPGAPTIGTGTSGDGQATIAFTPPAATGGSAITSYTATCGGISASGATSPITVPGLTNTVLYQCSVSATNSLGTGLSSASVGVTPSAGSALTLQGVKSRKTHTGLGVFDLAIDTSQPIGGTLTTEPRNIGTGHVIAFQFNSPVTSSGTASAIDQASAVVPVTLTFAGSDVLVTIPAVADKSRVTITLSNVNGAGGTFPVSLGFLVADANNNRIVNSGDIIGTKARSGNPLDQSNFRFDFNLNGAINSGDIIGVKARSGNTLN